MIGKISNYIVDKILYKNENISEEKREIMIFGITRIVEDLPKYVIIFVTCLVLGFLKELLIVFVFGLSYKTFLGGAHAKTNVECTIYSLIMFLVPIFVSAYIDFKFNIFTTIILVLNYIFGMILLIFTAPNDTAEIPIISKSRRKRLKICGIIMFNLIYISFIFLDIKNIVLISTTLFIINIYASNLMYKILKCTKGKDSEEYSHLYN